MISWDFIRFISPMYNPASVSLLSRLKNRKSVFCGNHHSNSKNPFPTSLYNCQLAKRVTVVSIFLDFVPHIHLKIIQTQKLPKAHELSFNPKVHNFFLCPPDEGRVWAESTNITSPNKKLGLILLLF